MEPASRPAPAPSRDSRSGEPAPARPQVRRGAVVRHLVLSVALWVTYLLYWRVVIARGIEREAAWAIGLLALFVVLQVLSTLAWVQHSRRLARRHAGRRRVRPAPPATLGADFLGRRIEVRPDVATLRRAPVVVARVEGDRKILEVGALPEGDA